jgi:transcriptional regulator with XRE-family HTH domain
MTRGKITEMMDVMEPVDRIHRDKQPMRPHHIADWAELRGMSQTDLSEALGADKSVISRWFSGSTPSTRWQDALVQVLQCDSTESLFRHPNDDWLARFLKGRDRQEVDRIKATLETAFPRKSA